MSMNKAKDLWTRGSKALRATYLMTAGFLLMRASYSRTLRDVLLTVGITVIELAGFWYVHEDAGGYQVQLSAWRARCGDRDHRLVRLEAARALKTGTAAEIAAAESELTAVLGRIELRRQSNFDIAAVAAAGLAIATEAYRAAVTENLAAYSVSRSHPAA